LAESGSGPFKFLGGNVAKQKPCLNILTGVYVNTLADCCGVGELGGFGSRRDAMRESFEYDWATSSYTSKPATPATLADVRKHITQEGHKLILATTIPSQKDAAQALKAAGFKKIATTPSREDPKRTISLWMWKDKK